MQYGLYVFGDAPARDAVLLDLASPAGDLRRLGVDIELVKDPHLLWLMWKSEGLSRLDLPALSARHPDTIIRLAWMDDEATATSSSPRARARATAARPPKRHGETNESDRRPVACTHHHSTFY